jgi:hypothetical protein
LALAMPGASTVALYRQQENADMAKTPTSPKQPASNGGKLPPGANGPGVHGTKAADAVKGAPRPKPVTIDRSFVADPRGGPELVVGKGHVQVKDNRSKVTR